MTTDLVKVSSAIEPQNMTELGQLAEKAAKSRFFGCETPEQALMVMMAGKDLGLSYTQSLRAFYIVKGRPCFSAQGMVAVCLKSPLCKYFRTVSVSATEATVETKRGDDPPRQATFTIQEARLAGLANKDNWKAYPSRMLLARAQAFLAREVYPDLLMGLYDPDEIEPAARPARRIEVVQMAPPTPEEQATREWAEHIEARLEAATEEAEFAEIAREMSERSKKTTLPAALRAQLVTAYKAAAERIKAAMHHQDQASEPNEAA